MRSHVPLAQFMPYGAPELLESSRPHLTRALLLSSTIGVALFLAMLGAAASGWFVTRVDLPVVAIIDVLTPNDDAPVNLPPPPPTEPSPAGAPKDASGPPVAVPDAQAEFMKDTFEPGAVDPPPVPFEGDGFGTHPRTADSFVARTQVFESIDVDEQPMSMNPLVAHYPDLAREAGVEGLVVVRVLVGPDGRVKEAVLLKSVPMLDEAALEAARRATFQPALVNNHPVSCWVAVPFRFRLR